ncbi:tRNA-specific adenosine deaminase [Geosporobacter ferrireducens]|uniref:tRNA-specific adenosine deaminase n=2 Tax=Geosporobacter ferrireducens TaxID=1424294 RepID=A0A1D8GQQ3_9FIRM|nr:tRNA-specific adenosine deaminase [Geosporobacter ferrireducens]MTI55599.1 nucleoside deaminase [Geosporobacter ferrireducens]
MKLALEEAKISLREGNNGFGAVIIKDEQIISSAHDTEDTDDDSTSHAEINAIKEASKKLGKKLTGCILVSTHEPCPMCATAVVWSGISEIAYGYSIKEAIKQGRKRIELTCCELFKRASANIKIHENILSRECSILYRKDVRIEIEKLRNANDQILNELNTDSINRRVKWFYENRERFEFINDNILDSGYKLLLNRFNITEDEAPIVEKSERKIVFHSKNFCPTLEACKILGLDTRVICKKLNENSTDTLIRQINPQLRFSRNYEKLRPYTEYCEEIISMEEK